MISALRYIVQTISSVRIPLSSGATAKEEPNAPCERNKGRRVRVMTAAQMKMSARNANADCRSRLTASTEWPFLSEQRDASRPCAVPTLTRPL